METKRMHKIKTGSDRTFGVVFTVFFLIVALLPLLKGHTPRLWAGVFAVAFLMAALIRPAVLHSLNIFWIRFGLLLNRIVEPIMTAIVYGVAILPFGLLLKLFKPDMLKMRYDADASTYWVQRDNVDSSMKNQF